MRGRKLHQQNSIPSAGSAKSMPRKMSSSTHMLAGTLAAAVMVLTGVNGALSASAERQGPIGNVAWQAQDATCTLAPLTLPLFAGITPPEATPTATPDVTAEEASASQEQAATQAIETIVACINSGDPKLVYGVFSQAYLARTYGDRELAYLPAFEQSLDGPVTPVTPPFVIESVSDIKILGDGQIEATITLSRDGDTWTSTVLLVQEDEAWLIDAVVS